MTHSDAPAIGTAVGSSVAFLSGLISQASTSSESVGSAALIVATGGLLAGVIGGITQLTKIVLDARARGFEEKINRLEEELAYSRTSKHEMANKFNAMFAERDLALVEANERVVESEKRVARLEGRLGIVATEHAEAINTNADSVVEIGRKLEPPVDLPHPHVEPTPPLFDPDDDSGSGLPGDNSAG